MNATTVTAPTEASATRGGLHPSGLTWATLRLHTWAALCWALLVLVAAGALLWAAGPGVDAAWAGYNTETCQDNGQQSMNCNYSAPALQPYNTAVTLVASLISLTPLLVAVWAGAALIGRELESGTAQLAWTQSVTPARWLAAKLAVPAALLTAGTLLLVLLHRTMWSAHTARGGGPWLWQGYETELYLSNGPLAVAHVLLGLAVGALAGLLARRTLPALAFGFLAMATLSYALEALRPYLWPAETATATAQEGTPAHAGMVVDGGVITTGGAHVPTDSCGSPDCGRTDVVGYYLDYHPSSHFWPLQLVETAAVLGVTALLVLAAFRLLRRRTEGTSSTRPGGTP
jgi:hypothetical protein